MFDVASKKTSRVTRPDTIAPVDTAAAKIAPAKTARPRRAAAASPKAPKPAVAASAEAAPARTVPLTRAVAKAKAKAPARRKVAVEAATPTPVAPAPGRLVTDEDIRLRAYFLSLEYRGQGSDIDFWLIAEREMRPRAKSRD
jgi:hypothetical protein